MPKTRVVVMTKAAQWVQRAVSTRELQSLEKEYGVRSIGISNANAKEEAHTKTDTRTILNALCLSAWARMWQQQAKKR